ncbi:MAG: outer membrane lipoprotein chaperone LolA [Burkholderiales bacterium]|nr:outer membrane lipoprotein chaperone LolA [Burkholderiales bacterium]
MVTRLIAACALAALAMLAEGATLDRLRAFVKDTRTARAQFVQTVVDRNGRPGASASGEFLLERPGKFRWTVTRPYRQLLVGDGVRVWIYDEDLNQVIVRRLGDALGATPAALLAGDADVERAFTWQDLPAADGLDWLAATPIDTQSSFTEIRLGFDAKGLAALELVDAFGQRSRVRFTAFERNPQLPAGSFSFTPPKGADVIGEK